MYSKILLAVVVMMVIGTGVGWGILKTQPQPQPLLQLQPQLQLQPLLQPQPFTMHDSYVIAVGESRDDLLVVQASDIVKALEVGKEIRLKWVKIEEDVEFHGKVKQAVYFSGVTFSQKADFSEAQFTGEADFTDAQFTGEADFSEAQFSSAYFVIAQFSNANFFGAQFSGVANFTDAQFTGVANFNEAQFTGEANFTHAQFSSASFIIAQFSNANFNEAQFTGEADFTGAQFTGVANFSYANFSDAKFSSTLNFSNSRFKDQSQFTGCLYAQDSQLNFFSVTGFSQMQMEWQYDPQWRTANDQDKSKRGIKGHLVYNETFYIALIKNYNEMGWLEEADDCYYTYHTEKRRNTGKSWLGSTWELLVLDCSFGYGVKPRKLLLSFIILWIPFSLIYVSCLRQKYKDGEKSPLSWSRLVLLRYKILIFIFWGLIHSLDVLTPGITFDSLKDPILRNTIGDNGYVFTENSRRTLWIQRGHQVLGWYLLALFFILFNKVWIR